MGHYFVVMVEQALHTNIQSGDLISLYRIRPKCICSYAYLGFGLGGGGGAKLGVPLPA